MVIPLCHGFINSRFLWCVALSLTYHDNLIYNVRGSFLFGVGRIPSYWLAIICAFVSAIMVDLAIISLRVTFFPKDADAFAELEKDPLIKTRFEEEAAPELQQSWSKSNQDDEIQILLDRPRSLEEGNATKKVWRSRKSGSGLPLEGAGHGTTSDSHERRRSLTHSGYDEEIAQQFGAVIRKPFKRLPSDDLEAANPN